MLMQCCQDTDHIRFKIKIETELLYLLFAFDRRSNLILNFVISYKVDYKYTTVSVIFISLYFSYSNVHYIARDGVETYMTVDSYPKNLEKKMKLLSYFHRYMREHLMKAGDSVARESDQLSRIPHLHQWCRTTSAVIMQLTNGTIQVCKLYIFSIIFFLRY